MITSTTNTYRNGTLHYPNDSTERKWKSAFLEYFRNIILNKHYNDHFGLVDGRTWPPRSDAFSMIGMRRLDHFSALVANAVETGVPGHVIETGVWRGGASFMAAKTIELLDQNRHRFTYLCDSFKGIPTTSKQFKDDLIAHKMEILNNNSLARVMNDAKVIGIDLQSLRFVEGYFNESLPALISAEPYIRFAVLRLDGDTYDSTMQSMNSLYGHLSPGGYIIIDDYTDWEGCRTAIDEFRTVHNIRSPIMLVPHMAGEVVRGVYWRKEIKSGGVVRPHCIGMAQGRIRKSRGLRVAGSYNPSIPRKMPAEGPEGVDILHLKGRTDIYYCS